jgi:hypothetical protein
MSVCPTLLVPHSLARTHNSQTHSRLTLSLSSHSTLSSNTATAGGCGSHRLLWHRLGCSLLPPHDAVQCLVMPSASLAGAIPTTASITGCSCCVSYGVNTQNLEILTLPGRCTRPHHNHTTPTRHHTSPSARCCFETLRIAVTATLATGSLLSWIHCVRVVPARLQHHLASSADLHCSHHLIPAPLIPSGLGVPRASQACHSPSALDSTRLLRPCRCNGGLQCRLW